MKLTKTEKILIIVLCIIIPALVVFGGLTKLEHWSEQMHTILFASGSFLAALLVLFFFVKSYYSKKNT